MPRRSRGPRTLVLALIALAVPLPALALNDGKPEPAGLAPVEMTVSASLGECGLVDTQIVCQIDASWDAVEGADYYTVSVTRADGSVVDYGETSATGTSLWVGYVGSGTYSVEVAAWGSPEDDAKPRVIARDKALSTASGGDAQGRPRTGPALAGDADPDDSEGGHGQAGEAPVAGEVSPAPGGGKEPAAESPCEEAANVEPGEPAPDTDTQAGADAETPAEPAAGATATADASAPATADSAADESAGAGAADADSETCP